MTPEELVTAVQVAGGGVRKLADGRFSLWGPVPEAIVEAIKGQRDQFLEAWDAERNDRYRRTPTTDIKLRKDPPHRMRAALKRRVQQYVLNQCPEVAGYAFDRSIHYHEVHPEWSDSDCATAAALDVVEWQLVRHEDPVGMLVALGEAFDEIMISSGQCVQPGVGLGSPGLGSKRIRRPNGTGNPEGNEEVKR